MAAPDIGSPAAFSDSSRIARCRVLRRANISRRERACLPIAISFPLFILPYSPLPLPSAAGRFFNDGVAWCCNLLSSRRIGFLRRQVGDGPTLKHDSRLSSGFPPSRISLRIAQSFEIRNDKFATRFTQVCFSKISTRVESEELLRTVVQKIYFSKVIIISYKIIHILFFTRNKTGTGDNKTATLKSWTTCAIRFPSRKFPSFRSRGAV